MTWAERGSCVTEYGLTFGNLPPISQVGVCGHCPVRSECLEDALAEERLTRYAPSGVRGGLTGKQRHSILRAERKAARDAAAVAG